MMTEYDFDDRNLWAELARKRGIRLPLWRMPNNPQGIRRRLKQLGWSVEEYLDWCGCRTLGEACALNPDWPLRAIVGLLLEEDEAQFRSKRPVA